MGVNLMPCRSCNIVKGGNNSFNFACCGAQFEKGFEEFENLVEDFKPKVGEKLYAETAQQIMIQVALQHLRTEGGKNNLDEFKARYVSVSKLVCRLDAYASASTCTLTLLTHYSHSVTE